MREDAFRDAAEQRLGDRAAPARAHDHQIERAARRELTDQCARIPAPEHRDRRRSQLQIAHERVVARLCRVVELVRHAPRIRRPEDRGRIERVEQRELRVREPRSRRAHRRRRRRREIDRDDDVLVDVAGALRHDEERDIRRAHEPVDRPTERRPEQAIRARDARDDQPAAVRARHLERALRRIAGRDLDARRAPRIAQVIREQLPHALLVRHRRLGHVHDRLHDVDRDQLGTALMTREQRSIGRAVAARGQICREQELAGTEHRCL